MIPFVDRFSLIGQICEGIYLIFTERCRRPPKCASGHGIGMDVMDGMVDIPLLSVLMFQQSKLRMPAEEMVDGLLMQCMAELHS